MKARRSKSITSCSFLSKAPWSGGSSFAGRRPRRSRPPLASTPPSPGPRRRADRPPPLFRPRAGRSWAETPRAHRAPPRLSPPLHGALLKNEQDVHLLERLAFLQRREGR